jgi:exodeoxyribonuclease-3
MKIATWNVNSIRARLERLLRWLEKEGPDALCLQELKVTEDDFPFEAIEKAGYRAAVYGQKTYNGVAILSREEPERIERGLMDDVDDPQARLLAADLGGIRIVCAYFPNGAEVGSDKFAYKLEWMERFGELSRPSLGPGNPVVLCGDFNVAPDDKDAAHPEQWQDTVLCVPERRQALERIRERGFEDVFRKHHPEGGIYSWWDYRQLGFPKNNGLRIDHLFATPELAARCVAARVDRDERKGKGRRITRP